MSELPTVQRLRSMLPPKESINPAGVEALDFAILGQSVRHLWTKCMDSYYADNFQECASISQWLLDLTWEKLNTGYWKDVPIVWRYLYSHATVFKALATAQCSPEPDIKAIIKICDMGLLLGAPILDNLLNRMASFLGSAIESSQSSKVSNPSSQQEPPRKRLRVDHWPTVQKHLEIPTLECPSLSVFRERHVLTSTPVVIKNGVDYWPAFTARKWNIDYIRKVAGCRTVPIELGAKYTDDTWSQQLLTVNEFIDSFILHCSEDTQVGYLAQHDLFSQIPELRKDIAIPTYCSIGESDDVDINAWFGPRGTVSPLHHDPKHNLLVQVIGEKYIRLYAEEFSSMVYPHDGQLLENTSQVDVENPDDVRFPDFRKAPYRECILNSGEMLYIPPRCWHYVRSLSVSFSVSFWWE